MIVKPSNYLIFMSHSYVHLIKYSAVSIFISLMLLSCEGFRVAEGVVVDANNLNPLDSVIVKVITAKNKIEYTDSLGQYNVSNRIAGCVFGCKDIIVEFSKPGFKTLELKNDACNGTIKMSYE